MPTLAEEGGLGRLDVVVSRFIERLVGRTNHPIVVLLHEGFKPELDGLLTRYLGPDAVPLPNPDVLKAMLQAGIRMRQAELERRQREGSV